MIPKSSPFLAKFYVEYGQWISDGCPEDVRFKRNAGLCGCVKSWCFARDIFPHQMIDLRREMRNQFEAAGLNASFPFTNRLDGHTLFYSYTRETERTKPWCSDNPKRIAWVRERIAADRD